jgi:RNA polymerase sigma-70 factor (ECF subfamily)
MDERAFDALYVATAGDVARFVARRVGTRTDVDDVVADCFLVAWRRAEQVPDDPEAARRWLFEVAHNAVRNLQRSRRRRAALEDRVRGDLIACGGVPRVELDPDGPALVRAFLELRTDERRVLLLAAAGHSGAAMAAELGCSVTAAVSRLSRARHRLEQLATET